MKIGNTEIELASEVANNAKNLIIDRKSGKRFSLKTRWDKINSMTMGGIEPNTILTIAGLSGSGKSSFANMLQQDFSTLSNAVVKTLYFSFEMLPERQFVRLLSSKLRIPVRDLLSSSVPLDTEMTSQVMRELDVLSSLNAYYVSQTCSVQEIGSIIEYFKSTLNKGEILLVILDHTLLVKNEHGQTPKNTVDELQKCLNFARKHGSVLIVQLAQMNRDIEAVERIRNSQVHYPTKADISTSDNMYQLSDYVMAIHIPELLGIQAYGLHTLPTKDMVYIHMLKNRDGQPCVFKFKNELKYNNLANE